MQFSGACFRNYVIAKITYIIVQTEELVGIIIGFELKMILVSQIFVPPPAVSHCRHSVFRLSVRESVLECFCDNILKVY